MAKNYSAGRVLSTLWGFTFIGMLKFAFSFRKPKVEDRSAEDETYNRLVTLFQKNKFGFHTKIMADFDRLLEALMNQKFIDDSTEYYDNPVSAKEIEDIEMGLNSDMTEADI